MAAAWVCADAAAVEASAMLAAARMGLTGMMAPRSCRGSPRPLSKSKRRRVMPLGGHSPGSTHRLRLGEFPCAIEDFRSRAKEAHRVVPALYDRQAIRNFAVATAELDGDRAVRALFRGDVIYGIGVVLVRLKVALGIVDTDRPKAADGHVLNGELVYGGAVIPGRRDREVESILLGSTAPD